MRTALSISHPGDVLTRLLARRDNGVTKEALLNHIQRSTLDELSSGLVRVNRELASKLESATGVSAEFWVSRQRDHDHQRALQMHHEYS